MIQKIKKYFSIILSFLILFSYTNTLAVFSPGQTLDPNCAPGTSGCTVSSSSSQWTTSGNNIYFTGGRVGIGTNNPNSLFSLKESSPILGSELVTNGSFDTDATGWELYDSSSYSSGRLSVDYTGVENWADVSTNISLESGKTYLLTFDLSEVDRDSVYFYFENNSFDSNEIYSIGKNVVIFTSDYTGIDTIYFENYNWNVGSSWFIDNVSIKEIGSTLDDFVFDISDHTDSSLILLGGVSNLVRIGQEAGSNSTNNLNSNFIGLKAGYSVINSTNSNFIGSWAGQGSETDYSNFIGQGSGQFTNNANYSNFIGYFAGQYASSSYNSNFIGPWAGEDATSASNSNFLGYYSGRNASNSYNSNFLGSNSGYDASNAPYSNFLGDNSGYGATNASYSNFLGSDSGYGATDSSYSNFIGREAGYLASGATRSNFIGSLSGSRATNAQGSNFLGYAAGVLATNASYSNFIGEQSGYTSTNAIHSNFLGYKSGESAPSASYSNFLGHSAGINASSADHSNFLGSSAGLSATNASNSNFLGLSAGSGATNASYSNFLGYNSGSGATNASYSTFLGYIAGSGATNASNSIFIGRNSGINDLVDNTLNSDDFSILIGKSTSTGGFKNSIAIGGSATNTASNQFMIGSGLRPIDTTRWNGSASTQCTLTTGTGIACTSDERLKINIEDLDKTTLEKILNLKTVTFDWKEGVGGQKNIGFLAQDLEQYFPELVSTDIDGYKSVYYANMTPVIVEAIRELNLKIISVNDLDQENDFRENIYSWFRDMKNGISEFIANTVRAKDKLCIGEESEEVCITKEELLQIKNNLNGYNNISVENNGISESQNSSQSDNSVAVEEGITEENNSNEIDSTNQNIIDAEEVVDNNLPNESINNEVSIQE